MAWTSEGTAIAEDVHGDVFGEFKCVLQSFVGRFAIGDEPCDFFGFIGGVIHFLVFLTDLQAVYFI